MKFSNNAVSALNASIVSGATLFVVQSAQGGLFPSLSAGEYFYVRLGDDSSNEVVKVTARTGDTFTCEATTAGWGAGAAVTLTVSSEMLEDLVQADGAGQVLSDHEFKDIAETRTTPSSSSGTLTLDLENGHNFEVTLTENVTTLTISNPPASGKAGAFTLILKQDATGSRTVTWPASMKWADGTAPTLSTDANAVDILTFITTDAGTTWYGGVFGLAFAAPA
jgi:hypothetical protein